MITTQVPLLEAAHGRPVPYTPVWFMRQAGRALPEYRRVREKHDFLSICRQPELCAEVTLQPVKRLGVDAAIIFADIVLPLLHAGVDVELVENVGPVVRSPIRTLQDVERLGHFDPDQDVAYLLDAIRLVRNELPQDKALIGFAGAPFTLATYLLEGRPSRDYTHTKAMMYHYPEMWHALMRRLGDIVAAYLQAQARAGAQVLQLFDSWVGWLSPSDYQRYVVPYSSHILQSLRGVGVPLIHFGTGTGGLLEMMRDAGAQVVGLDWRVSLDVAWDRLGPGTAVQGNLDPAVLLGPWEIVQAQAENILCRAAGRPGHIFNLGHGLLPDTPLDNLFRLVAFVHEHTFRLATRAEPRTTRQES